MPKRNGIDVSHYQGVIDWGKVAGSGVVWAATKATQGTGFVDKTLSRNRVGMTEQRIKHRLFYHWLNPTNIVLRASSTARNARTPASNRRLAPPLTCRQWPSYRLDRLLPVEGVRRARGPHRPPPALDRDLQRPFSQDGHELQWTLRPLLDGQRGYVLPLPVVP